MKLVRWSPSTRPADSTTMSPVATRTDAANTKSCAGTPSATPIPMNASTKLRATVTTTRYRRPRNRVAYTTTSTSPIWNCGRPDAAAKALIVITATPVTTTALAAIV